MTTAKKIIDACRWRLHHSSYRASTLDTMKVLIQLLLQSLLFQAIHAAAQHKCERLKTHLSYRQDNAPKDISAVVRTYVTLTNSNPSRRARGIFKFVTHELTNHDLTPPLYSCNTSSA